MKCMKPYRKGEIKVRYLIEYEIPPLRMIDYRSIEADSKGEAIHYFKLEYPQSKIREIKGSDE